MTMPEQRSYTALFTFDGRGWIVQFRDPDISTFGRSLVAAKAHARSVLAVHLEVAELASVGAVIEEEVRLPGRTGVEVDRLAQLRKQADALRRELTEETRRATSDLRKAGLSTRDVGELLGISGARVAQIERDAAAV